MPPEEAHGLVYLEGFFRAGQLWVQPTRIDEVKGGAQPPPLELLWYEHPSGRNRSSYWMLGDDVAFIRRNDAYRDPEQMEEIEMPVSGKGYWWQDYAEAIVLVLPGGYTIVPDGAAPQAKVAKGARIALLWSPGPISFRVAKLSGASIEEVKRINAKFGPIARSNRLRERAYLESGARSTKSFWNFWTTLPGILTGIAGILTAAAVLITALVSTGLCSGTNPGPATPTGQPVLHLDPMLTLDFGSHSVKEYPITKSEMVTNYGQGILRLDTPPHVEGDGFALSNSSSCYFTIHTLAHGDRCSINIVFLPPPGTNQYTGRLTITDTFDGLSQSVGLRAISL